jgi:hypothetical protein
MGTPSPQWMKEEIGDLTRDSMDGSHILQGFDDEMTPRAQEQV